MKSRGLWSVQRRLGNIVPLLKVRAKSRRKIIVLEVGCGYGRAMQQLGQRIPQLRVIGMNIKQYAQQLPGQKYIYGDAGKRIPLPSNSVDFIYSIATLPFVCNRARFFEEAFRVLRPGGQLRVNLLRDWGTRFGVFRIPDRVEGGKRRNLYDVLGSLNDYDIKLLRSERKFHSGLVVLNKRAGDSPLKLGLKFVPEKCTDYGPLFGREFSGFVRNVYIATNK
ncbi:class I SAM-dependent methyltransferase [Candidatus Woesearchaeota archaeon]|nr:class I SAM-dependent methyltransferase [Candidatus Woesearchaeota archaeon]